MLIDSPRFTDNPRFLTKWGAERHARKRNSQPSGFPRSEGWNAYWVAARFNGPLHRLPLRKWVVYDRNHPTGVRR